MEHQVWKENLLDAVTQLGEEGRAAVEFLRARRIKIGFMQVRPNVGAFWTVFGNIRLNSLYYTYETPFDELRIKTLIIHEARHLQQGLITALSVYGEVWPGPRRSQRLVSVLTLRQHSNPCLSA